MFMDLFIYDENSDSGYSWDYNRSLSIQSVKMTDGLQNFPSLLKKNLFFQMFG